MGLHLYWLRLWWHHCCREANQTIGSCIVLSHRGTTHHIRSQKQNNVQLLICLFGEKHVEPRSSNVHMQLGFLMLLLERLRTISLIRFTNLT
jgi:hypothetical protein